VINKFPRQWGSALVLSAAVCFDWIPACAGMTDYWIPACAGMTD